MRGKLRDLTFGAKGEQHITITVTRDFREDFDRLKDTELDVEIKKHRNRRSLSANAYFHVLVSKIAAVCGGSEDSVKEWLVLEYGALAKDKDGMTVGFKLPASVDVSTIYPYLMDSKEMARLIDGAIETAREMGIETDTPEQMARYKELWSRM